LKASAGEPARYMLNDGEDVDKECTRRSGNCKLLGSGIDDADNRIIIFANVVSMRYFKYDSPCGPIGIMLALTRENITMIHIFEFG
jgi:hypothetical protein